MKQLKLRGAGGRSNLGAEDVLFLIRHDRQKLNRLRLFLSWKDVRKNVKDKEGRTQELTVDELMEDTQGDGDAQDGDDAQMKGQTQQNATGAARVRRRQIRFSWEPLSAYTGILGAADEDASDDEDQRDAYMDQNARLKAADEATRNMSHEQYIFYSECRQASFTYKKAKRFRDWSTLSAQVGTRINVDLVDTLGFLAHEMVTEITETALAVKTEWESSSSLLKARGKRRRDPLQTDLEGVESTLFAREKQDRTPLTNEHIWEAYRRLEVKGAMSVPVQTFRTGRAVNENVSGALAIM